ncbi:MAG: hypothetical protein SFV21_02665 [Rhodospirillaceae bacterium]|nr:hypothetical protein [Rhodospirillaceae bacterium]
MSVRPRSVRLGRPKAAALAYFAIAFSVGFALGTVRVMLVVPLIGDFGAVALELPVMLAVSWLAAGWCVRRFAVPARAAPRLLMGGLAFALLMLAELGVSVLAFGRSPADHLATYRQAAALAGLAAQVGFALLPWLRTITDRKPSRPA